MTGCKTVNSESNSVMTGLHRGTTAATFRPSRTSRQGRRGKWLRADISRPLLSLGGSEGKLFREEGMQPAGQRWRSEPLVVLSGRVVGGQGGFRSGVDLREQRSGAPALSP